jgi:hypothetical protein
MSLHFSPTVGTKFADSVDFHDVSDYDGDSLESITVFTSSRGSPYVSGFRTEFRFEKSLPNRGLEDVLAQCTASTSTIERGDYVVSMSGRAGWFIDQLHFSTNRLLNLRPVVLRSTGGDVFQFIVRPGVWHDCCCCVLIPCSRVAVLGYEICGFHGSYGGDIHQLGVVARRVRGDFRTYAHRLSADLKQALRTTMLILYRNHCGLYIGLIVCEMLIDAHYPIVIDVR